AALAAALAAAEARAQTSQLKDLEFTGDATRTVHVSSPSAARAGYDLNIVGSPGRSGFAGGDVVVSAGSSTFTQGNVLLSPTTGFVGIRTGNPGQPLDVGGNFKFTRALMPNNVPGNTGQFLLTKGTNTAPVWTETFTGDVAFGSGSGLTLYNSSLTLAGAGATITQNGMPVTSTGITTTGGIHAAFFSGDASGVVFPSTPTIPPQAIQGNPFMLISSMTLSPANKCISLSWTDSYVAYTLRFYSPSQSAADIPCLYWGYGGTLPATFDDGGANKDYSWGAAHNWTDAYGQKVKCQQLVDTAVAGTTYEEFFTISVIFNFSGATKPAVTLGVMDMAPASGTNATFAAGTWYGPAGDNTKLITGAEICNLNNSTFAAGASLSVYGSY
ncbi:MAG: hypothetical protein NTX64_18975, partial [Elusimicrobia bacterium]|nr:hypothetical protein [Elusimicrobiota bacterium]